MYHNQRKSWEFSLKLAKEESVQLASIPFQAFGLLYKTQLKCLSNLWPKIYRTKTHVIVITINLKDLCFTNCFFLTLGCQKSSYFEASKSAVRPTNCISLFLIATRERYWSNNVTVRYSVSGIKSNLRCTCQSNK